MTKLSAIRTKSHKMFVLFLSLIHQYTQFLQFCVTNTCFDGDLAASYWSNPCQRQSFQSINLAQQFSAHLAKPNFRSQFVELVRLGFIHFYLSALSIGVCLKGLTKEKWQCLIHNDTLESFIWSKSWKIKSFFWV